MIERGLRQCDYAPGGRLLVSPRNYRSAPRLSLPGISDLKLTTFRCEAGRPAADATDLTNVRTTEAPPNPTVRDLLTKVLLVRFQLPSSLHSRFEGHLPMPDWRDEGTTLGSASRAKIVGNQFLRRRSHMKFILVNGRNPRRESLCSLCCEPIGESYLRELTTRLSFCNYDCYLGHCKPAFSVLEQHV